MKTTVSYQTLERFVRDVFVKLKVPKKDAELIADVLITADLKGYDTHGVQRLKMYYDRIRSGIYEPKTKVIVIKNKGTTALLDGRCGMGHVIAHHAMKLAMKKAKKFGLGAVACRNSTHFGIAGYWSQMAIDVGMIGITTTNARPAIAPTYSVEPMLGTNPLTIGAPTDEKFPFLIDCATSIIQRGKIELNARLGKKMLEGVVVNSNGKSAVEPKEILEDLLAGTAALLPLGGLLKDTGSHKGYGYATAVEILSSALQDGVYLKDTQGVTEKGKTRLKVGHFFLAIDIAHFIPLRKFKKIAGNIMRGLRSAKKAPGKKRIFTPGEQSYKEMQKRKKKGIVINEDILKDLKEMREELGISGYKF